jgi:acyl dehydratase
MTGKKWAFEDFVEGGSIALGSKRVTAEEIIEFASEFDAQPMHLDEEAGKASILGGLSASGWHTCSIFMRIMCDGFLLNSTSQGSPGLDYVRWKKPVLAGDTLTGKSTIVAKRASKSKPGLGFVTLKSELSNQRGEIVLELENTGMFLTHEAAGAA